MLFCHGLILEASLSWTKGINLMEKSYIEVLNPAVHSLLHTIYTEALFCSVQAKLAGNRNTKNEVKLPRNKQRLSIHSFSSLYIAAGPIY